VRRPYAHFRVIPISGGASTRLAEVSAPDVALAVAGRESFRYNSGIHTGYQLSRRTAFDASYQHEILDFVPLGQRDWRTQDASVSLTQSMTAKTALVAGYSYHRRDFEGERLPLRRHDINFGVNYNSALPFLHARHCLQCRIDGALRARSTATATSEAVPSMIGRASSIINSPDLALGTVHHRGVISRISDVFLADSVTGNLEATWALASNYARRPATRPAHSDSGRVSGYDTLRARRSAYGHLARAGRPGRTVLPLPVRRCA
jgi:hypothetical protein